MGKPIFVRELSTEEFRELSTGLKSSKPFTVRRCQMVLASSRGEIAPKIAKFIGCDEQTVRNAIKAFNERGLAALQAGSRRPKTVQPLLGEEQANRLKALLHRSPRDFGKEISLWTLELAAEVSFAEGLTPRQVSGECIRLAQQSGWVVGFQDETWWSRFAQPNLSSWCEDQHPLRLAEQVKQKDDPDPKALACYGMLLRWQETEDLAFEKMLLRFVDGRPVSAITIQFLEWVCQQIEALEKSVLAMIWDNPVKSPWLNPIEPKWAHGKRRIVEPDDTLTKQELADRICATFDCPHDEHLFIPENVS